MTLILKPILLCEEDGLTGNEHKKISILELGEEVVCILTPPSRGWTHECLDELDTWLTKTYAETGWNAYFGSTTHFSQLEWIGSSEV